MEQPRCKLCDLENLRANGGVFRPEELCAVHRAEYERAMAQEVDEDQYSITLIEHD